MLLKGKEHCTSSVKLCTLGMYFEYVYVHLNLFVIVDLSNSALYDCHPALFCGYFSNDSLIPCGKFRSYLDKATAVAVVPYRHSYQCVQHFCVQTMVWLPVLGILMY